MPNKTRTTIWAGVAAVLGIEGVALGQHEHEVLAVGRDAAGQLHMHTHSTMPFGLKKSVFPGVPGWAGAEVALESLQEDHPAIGLFVLEPGCDIRAVLVSAEPGVRVYGGIDPLPVGGELVMGPPFFHFLPLWNIHDGALGQEYTLQLKFRDASGKYSESEPFPVTFKIACVADLSDDGKLDVLDFAAFQNLFALGDSKADINEDGNLDILDFVAFQNAFALGCS